MYRCCLNNLLVDVSSSLAGVDSGAVTRLALEATEHSLLSLPVHGTCSDDIQ